MTFNFNKPCVPNRVKASQTSELSISIQCTSAGAGRTIRDQVCVYLSERLCRRLSMRSGDRVSVVIGEGEDTGRIALFKYDRGYALAPTSTDKGAAEKYRGKFTRCKTAFPQERLVQLVKEVLRTDRKLDDPSHEITGEKRLIIDLTA